MAEFSNFRPCSEQIRFSDYTYHVFLSFRGPDIRTSFVDHLFQAFKAAGIHAFLDTEKLQKGEIIGSSLEKAIQNSAILIPIFSKGYADSPWCLDEVRQMWQCRSATNRLIIPLFYDVDPSDVRYAQKVNGKYAEAFNNHYSKGRFESQKIEEWKDALHKVSSLSGWSPIMTAGYEAKLVKQIVSDITALNCFPRPVLQIGLKNHSEKVKEPLALDQTDRTVRLGIWSIGGIGKTTLAEAIFNELCCTFEASCFLSDIRSAHERHGIIGLQTQMLKDLSKIEVKVNDINHGKSLLQFHLASIRSLVVLDNVDHWRQFDSFMLDFYGPGSRVIVTTRDRHILNSRMPPENIYELEGLREDEALELFSWHAFHKAKPDDAYRDLSTNIIQASGGVPLTLEVLGAFLLDKKDSDNCWIEALIMLENLTDPNIFEPLKISYDSLLPFQKEIFLDIACLFIGQHREDPSIFWKELGLYVDTALSNERFRRDFQVIFEIEELKRKVEPFTEKLEVFIEKLKAFESEHLEDMKTMVESCRAEGSEAGLLEDLKRMWGGWEDLKRISQAEFSYYENLKTILERLKGLTDKFTEVMGGLEEHMLSLRSPHEALKMCMRELRVSVGSVKYYSILRRHRGEVEIQNDYLECFKEYIKEFLKWHKKYEYVDLVSYKLSILSLKISINSKCSKLDV